MLSITYNYDDSGARISVIGKEVAITDKVVAVFHVARSCGLDKEDLIILVSAWDSLNDTLKKKRGDTI